MTLRVELVVPDGEVWSGEARMVIAKTLDGDLGVLTGHPPVLGILAEGGVVQVLDPRQASSQDTSAGPGAPGRGQHRVPVRARRPDLDPGPAG